MNTLEDFRKINKLQLSLNDVIRRWEEEYGLTKDQIRTLRFNKAIASIKEAFSDINMPISGTQRQELSLRDLLAVQPMTGDTTTVFPMDFVTSETRR